MSEVVLGGDGRAVIHNTETGEALACSVPTALENVANGKGLWAHGEGEGEGRKAAAHSRKPAVTEPVISLSQDDVLPLPEADRAPAAPGDDLADVRTVAGDGDDKHAAMEQEVDAANTKPDPLDHDANGKKGGAKRAAPDPERVALFAALDAKGIKYFKGAKTDALKKLLAG